MKSLPKLGHRYSFEKRSIFWKDYLWLVGDVLAGMVMCAAGRHHPKFGTWPHCYRCGKDTRRG